MNPARTLYNWWIKRNWDWRSEASRWIPGLNDGAEREEWANRSPVMDLILKICVPTKIQGPLSWYLRLIFSPFCMVHGSGEGIQQVLAHQHEGIGLVCNLFLSSVIFFWPDSRLIPRLFFFFTKSIGAEYFRIISYSLPT